MWLGCDAPSAVAVIGWAQEDGFLYGEHKPEGSSFLKNLLEVGKVAPVIDRRYPLSDAAEAFRYLAEGHLQGEVVLNVRPCVAPKKMLCEIPILSCWSV